MDAPKLQCKDDGARARPQAQQQARGSQRVQRQQHSHHAGGHDVVAGTNILVGNLRLKHHASAHKSRAGRATRARPRVAAPRQAPRGTSVANARRRTYLGASGSSRGASSKACGVQRSFHIPGLWITGLPGFFAVDLHQRRHNLTQVMKMIHQQRYVEIRVYVCRDTCTVR